MTTEQNKTVVREFIEAINRQDCRRFDELLSADFISIYRLALGRIVEAWVEWDSLNGLIQLGHLRPSAM